MRRCSIAALCLLTGALLLGAAPVRWAARAPQDPLTPAAPAHALVFDGVTVIDVQTGALRPAQRVVIQGNRIAAVGTAGARGRLPAGARVVDAHGTYLIPGLWDMHVHPQDKVDFFYPLFIATGVTGIRDGWSKVPLDSTLAWQREILAGARVGPPRQLHPGPALDHCDRPRHPDGGHSCVTGADDARHVVDSLHAEGATFIKTYHLDEATYFAVAAEARKLGLPFGGHLTAAPAAAASDSGATFIDHLNSSGTGEGSVFRACVDTDATDEACRRLADTFRRHDTWFVPTLTISALTQLSQWRRHRPASDTIFARLEAFANDFWAGSARSLDFQRGPVGTGGVAGTFSHSPSHADSAAAGPSSGILQRMHRVGLPILAGTDDNAGSMGALPPGFTLDAELAMYVAEGLTPLEALQTATLNPARALHATDSLGTVAPGKLADLVLLDANPLANIDNLTKIRAVVANGRYFDRAALDQLLAGVR